MNNTASPRPQNVRYTSKIAYHAHEGKVLQTQRLAALLAARSTTGDTTDREAAALLNTPAAIVSARRNDIIKDINRQGFYLLDGVKYRIKNGHSRKSRVPGARITSLTWLLEAMPEQLEIPFLE